MIFKKIYDKFKRNKDVGNKSLSRDVSSQHRSRRSADSDRCDIRVLEERMAFDQNSDWALGTRKAQESFSRELIRAAKETGLYLTKEQCSELGKFIPIRSGESKIYENAAQGLIYKIRDPFAKLHLKSPNLRHLLYEHVIHNLLFPETRYAFIGITDENDVARIVYSQKLFFESVCPTQGQIVERLAEIGLTPEPYYYFGNDFVSVTDVNTSSDNVMLSSNTILFIDPVIKIKQDPEDVIEHLLS